MPTASRCPALHPHSEEPSGGLSLPLVSLAQGAPKNTYTETPEVGSSELPPTFPASLNPGS